MRDVSFYSFCVASRIMHYHRNARNSWGRLVGDIWKIEHLATGNTHPCIFIDHLFLQVLWLGSGIANLCFFGWWVFETDSGFSKLILQSQYPYPSIGPAAIGALAFTLIICSLGIFVTLAGCIEDAVFWQKVK